MSAPGLGVRRLEFWYKICHQLMLPHLTQTQILHCKTGLAKAPFKLENVITLQPLVLQFLQSTKKAEKVKKHRQVIPDSLKSLRIIESIILSNPESHTHTHTHTNKPKSLLPSWSVHIASCAQGSRDGVRAHLQRASHSVLELDLIAGQDFTVRKCR